MGEIREELSVKQVHDNDKYILSKAQVEDVNSEQLKIIYLDIFKGVTQTEMDLTKIPEFAKAREDAITKAIETEEKAIEKHKKDIADIPAMNERVEKNLRKDLDTLNKRLIAIGEYAKKFVTEEELRAIRDEVAKVAETPEAPELPEAQ